MLFVKTIETASELKDEFRNMNRDQYEMETYEGLIDFYNECYAEPQELDVIAICCDLSEMTYGEVISDYGLIGTSEDFEEMQEQVLDYLNGNTIVIGYNDEYVSFLAF